ncbi:hypothetical protein A5731_00290 [Mycolicibacterium conceptionense]|uniref:hypothetical protein n=1 Tax=Mycolicibacterium conceptionense TaxID=451644 RepID=UPI0007EBA631|nr:hypothetical protein [Mycolicibacterium conceptionense]OBB15442.1 hypothetical protein A5718_29675 [Mycolicibacterium conceptionense]OBF09185.1 hypothetical protein A5731_00290 [Mycolicibacterium conceptionense]
MRIGDTYVGLGEGDRSPEIVKLKALLKRKFTPARNTLDDGDLFTPELTAEVRRIQGIYTAEGKPGAPHYIPGVVNLEFKYDVGLLKRPDPVKPIVFTVEGHTGGVLERQGGGVPVPHRLPVTHALLFQLAGGLRTGPDEHVAHVVEALYRQLSSQWIEGPPVDPNNPDGPKVMWWFGPEVSWGGIAFSQGAMIFCEFMWKYVLPPNAPLHYRLKTFRRGLMFGNPRRAKDAVCSWAQSPPDPGTSGIMTNRLFDAKLEGIADRWAEHPNDDDMFAEVSDDAAGRDQTAIARIVTENSWVGGPTALFSRVLALFGNPVGEGFAAVKAAFDAIMFLSANPNPHYSTFATPGDVEWMRGVAA